MHTLHTPSDRFGKSGLALAASGQFIETIGPDPVDGSATCASDLTGRNWQRDPSHHCAQFQTESPSAPSNCGVINTPPFANALVDDFTAT